MDSTLPTVTMDAHGLEQGTGITTVNDQCCQIRPANQPGKLLPIVASADDPESDIASIEIRADAIKRCQGTDSLGVTRIGLFDTDIPLGTTSAPSGPTAPTRLVANANFRLSDYSTGGCPPIQVEDATGIHNRDRQLLQSCGARLLARARDGKGLVTSTRTILIVGGQPLSAALPCPQAPF